MRLYLHDTSTASNVHGFLGLWARRRRRNSTMHPSEGVLQPGTLGIERPPTALRTPPRAVDSCPLALITMASSLYAGRHKFCCSGTNIKRGEKCSVCGWERPANGSQGSLEEGMSNDRHAHQLPAHLVAGFLVKVPIGRMCIPLGDFVLLATWSTCPTASVLIECSCSWRISRCLPRGRKKTWDTKAHVS